MSEKTHGDECWNCHVPIEPHRPHRAEFDSEPAWLVACAVYLDFTFPKREKYRARIREWIRLEIEADPVLVRQRIRELVLQDGELSTAEDRELDELTRAWETHRKSAQPNKKAKSES